MSLNGTPTAEAFCNSHHANYTHSKISAGLFHTKVIIKMSLLQVFTKKNSAKIEMEIFKFPIKTVHNLNSGTSETSKRIQVCLTVKVLWSEISLNR